MLEFIKTIPSETLLAWICVIVIALFLAWVVWKRKWGLLRSIAEELMEQAEKNIVGTKMGQERFNRVFSLFYYKLPWWIRFFFPEQYIKDKLQKWFNDIKNKLHENKPPDEYEE